MDEILGKRLGAQIAFVVTALCTAFAIILIPEDPSPAAALVFSAVVLSGGILAVPFLRAMFGLDVALGAENFVAFGVAYWLLLDLIQGAYPLEGISSEAVTEAMGLVGLFTMAMWLGTLGRPWRLPRFITSASERPLDTGLVWKLTLVCFVLGMSPFIISVNFDVVGMFSYLGQDRWSAPWMRGQLGDWGSFLDQMQYFGYLVPSLVVVLGVRQGWIRSDVWIGIGMALIVVLFLSQGGGRRIVGVTVGAAIICWTMMRPHLNVRTLFAILVAAGLLLWTMQFMLAIRSEGYEGYLISGSQLDYLHVDDNIYRLMQIIDIVPAEHPYVYFQQIFYVLVRPIPRVFWEGKPIDAGFDLPSILGKEGVSLSSSILGEWYLVLGWLAVIFGGWFHGRLASAVNALIENTKGGSLNPIVFSIGVMVLVAGLRSMQELVLMSYAILAWYAVTWLIPRREIVFRRRD